MSEIEIDYIPQARQKDLHECPANEILYGGAAGPGKSHALRFEGLTWCLRVPGIQVYLFRRTFPELEKNHILPSLMQFPKDAGHYKSQARRWEFNNGSMLHFCHCQYEQDVFNYQGAEIHLLIIDELTTFTEFQYDYLRGRVRCALEIPEQYRHKIPGIVCGSNPGGVGHSFAKLRWVDFTKKGAIPLLQSPKKQGGMLRAYIPGRLEDNPILMERDPEYIHRLDALPEPFRTAYKEGDWDIFMGQAFMFSRDHHVIKPRPIPQYAPLYMTFDWGFGAPFSIGWWYVDSDNRLIMFAEWYGWNKTPNQGLRLTDPLIAYGIVEREEKLGIWGRPITRFAGHDSFNKKPDFMGGGQGDSTATVFGSFEYDGRPCPLNLVPADPNRVLKIRQFHERLRIRDDCPPMLQVFDTCEQFIRTIPLLQSDPNNVEDVDTKGEDHCYDSAAQVCMARPLGIGEDKIAEMEAERIKKETRADLDSTAQAAWAELDKLQQKILEMQEEMDDGYDF